MIVDLSFPDKTSVNNGICEDWCYLQYASVDHAVEMIRSVGIGVLLVKLDLKDAYRLIPVHPDDQCLLGISWQGHMYVNRSLPFGLRSAPKTFTAFSDMLAWAVHCQGVQNILHYLDDFLLIGSPSSSEAAHALETTMAFFTKAGIAVAAHKTEEPSTCLSFLGILIDTHSFQLRLPVDKVGRLRTLLSVWSSRRSCTRRELESFAGHLAHAAVVARPGRIFVRSLFSLLATTSKPYHHIHLNAAV
jgi:hypothetical protein